MEEESIKEELKKTIGETKKKSEESHEQVRGIMKKVEEEKAVENLLEKK